MYDKTYHSIYYQANKDRISKKTKERYEEIKNDPELWNKRKERNTENTRRYRARHPEKVKLARKETNLKRRKRILNLLGGSFCQKCGCDVIDFLEVNHKNGGGSREWKLSKMAIGERVLAKKRDTSDLNILCRICNAFEYLKRKNQVEASKYTIKWAKPNATIKCLNREFDVNKELETKQDD